MKIFVLALLLLGSAQAATKWEYATMREHSIGSVGGVFWEDPDNFINGKDFGDIILRFKCSGGTYNSVLNCVGLSGWELVTRFEENIQGTDVMIKNVYTVFKRQK